MICKVRSIKFKTREWMHDWLSLTRDLGLKSTATLGRRLTSASYTCNNIDQREFSLEIEVKTPVLTRCSRDPSLLRTIFIKMSLQRWKNVHLAFSLIKSDRKRRFSDVLVFRHLDDTLVLNARSKNISNLLPPLIISRGGKSRPNKTGLVEPRPWSEPDLFIIN